MRKEQVGEIMKKVYVWRDITGIGDEISNKTKYGQIKRKRKV